MIMVQRQIEKEVVTRRKRDTLVNVKIKHKLADNEIKEQRNKTPCKKMIMVQRQIEKEVVTGRKGTPW